MDHLDSIKQLLSRFLPGTHILAASALLVTLMVIELPPSGSDRPEPNADLKLENIITQTAINNTQQIQEPTVSAVAEPPSSLSSEPDIIRELITLEVKSGDNLSYLFSKAGLTAQDVYKISHSGPESKILNRLYPGYQLSFDVSDQGLLKFLEVRTTPLESYTFTLTENARYEAKHLIKSPDLRQRYKEASIRDSLFLSAQRGGIPAALTMELAGIFGGVIDFMLDTRQGDSFSVLYEEKYLEGEFIGNGAILAAKFTNQGKTYTALRYVNEKGESGYYNLEGESMRKTFLRSPIDIVRITSGFSLARKHPILNTVRAHKGTDYAAPRGTPVQATSDGKVTWAARNGSFGKLVVVQHGERFQTKYAHLSSYARGIKKGAKVKQGQIIGYVGSTGGATGPHLHYEFLMDGVHRNSRTILDKLPKAKSLPENELPRFLNQTRVLLAQLESYSQPRSLALNHPH